MNFISFRFYKFSYEEIPWNTTVITTFGLLLHIFGWSHPREDECFCPSLASVIFLLAILFLLCHIQWVLTEPLSEVGQHVGYVLRTVTYWIICDIVIDHIWMPHFNYVCGSTMLALTILMLVFRVTGVTQEMKVTLTTEPDATLSGEFLEVSESPSVGVPVDVAAGGTMELAVNTAVELQTEIAAKSGLSVLTQTDVIENMPVVIIS